MYNKKMESYFAEIQSSYAGTPGHRTQTPHSSPQLTPLSKRISTYILLIFIAVVFHHGRELKERKQPVLKTVDIELGPYCFNLSLTSQTVDDNFRSITAASNKTVACKIDRNYPKCWYGES